jgi:hypothetical protein
MRHFSSILLLALTGALAAQGVPHGDAIQSSFSDLAPVEGLLLVSRSGTTTPVTGLALTARGSDEINSIQLDPVDNRVWIGGIAPVAGRVDTFTIAAGNTVAGFAAVANIGTASVSGIAFDPNGNAICSSGAISGTGAGGIFRIDRGSGVATRIAGGATWTFAAGTANCVATDRAGNIYFGVTSAGAPIYQLAPDANGDYTGLAVALGTVAPPSTSSTISGLDYAPASGARPARIWWTTFGAAGTNLGHIPAGGGAAVAAGPGLSSAPNWIDYDELVDDFWAITGGINPDEIFSVDHVGTPTRIAQTPPGGVNGSPSAIDANDCLAGGVTVLPQYVPASGAFTLEVGTCCPPGQVGGVFMPQFGIVLVSGVAPTDGRIFTAFRGLSFPRGFAGSIVFQAVCVDRTTGRLTLGQPQRWPRN